MSKRKHLPWPVLFAMYRSACSPRIFMKPGAELHLLVHDDGETYLRVGGEVTIRGAENGMPTIVIGNKTGEKVFAA